MLLTRLPLPYAQRHILAQLACLSHAASVHSEPGSNSPYKILHLVQSRPSLSRVSLSVSSEGNSFSLLKSKTTTLKFLNSVSRTFAQSKFQRTVPFVTIQSDHSPSPLSSPFLKNIPLHSSRRKIKTQLTPISALLS